MNNITIHDDKTFLEEREMGIAFITSELAQIGGLFTELDDIVNEQQKTVNELENTT
eukprot:CAMPEP_0114691120 /NCGR_PEP_ID=MMETSP0191-20121206/66473_1 /TAXON_ID=126664 /ORGANISM="Sorites sp." /LENGTH=55 /DNA_ID=CAMNT_0001981911 /DNA_START=440 /DNA_END=603 /DNA_ORIENTATION=+